MKCAFCDFPETKVLDSRLTEANDVIRRRRECLKCSHRFTTYERVEEIPLTVVKKTGEREPFDRNKLLNGLLRATVKRQVPRQKIEKLVDEIEAELRNNSKYEVSSKEIGEMTLRRLRPLDKVAYVRFASVYREFQDLDEFTAELKKLQRRGSKRS